MKYIQQTTTFVFILLLTSITGYSQFNRQDSLRGGINPERTWWDVLSYDLKISVDIANKFVSGTNTITYKIKEGDVNKVMQIDLQPPMEITRIESSKDTNVTFPFTRDGNVFHVQLSKDVTTAAGTDQSIIIHFSGKPRIAVHPPWDGGWIFTKDEMGRPFVSVACQGLGASVWYPCKDYQGDEPDAGASLSIDIPDTLVAVSNGKQSATAVKRNGRVTYQWKVSNPINNYNIIPYIGKYVSFGEDFAGAKGNLKCEYWVLDYNLQKAKLHFAGQVKKMLTCFEDWFGPYPFYEDNYKLVEAPHLGMEHQSAVAYGNKYLNGYLGKDLSGSGWGDDWDYIVVHESGHEWFGNNITTRDIADMWVHEGFTTYSEVIYTGCAHGIKAANEYAQGLTANMENDRPVIGPYGVNKEGSSDMYNKGASLIHIIRQLINDDSKFKSLLRGLNKEFYHKVVTSAMIEKYIIDKTGLDLSAVFDQYLRNPQVPTLEYRVEKEKIFYRWTNCIDRFNMPVKVTVAKQTRWLKPTTKWQVVKLKSQPAKNTLVADRNFYIMVRQASSAVTR